jgi:hypothetical protein
LLITHHYFLISQKPPKVISMRTTDASPANTRNPSNDPPF